MTDIEIFHQSLLQEIASRQMANENGNTQEEIFTQIAVDYLSETGDTENVTIAYDEKNLGKKGQHKINGYAIADNYETVDLFISIFDNSDTIRTIAKADIDTATKRITNFFRKAVYNDYVNEVAESSPIFEFANTLANFQELKENLVRVNALILTNSDYKGEIPATAEMSGYKIFYRVLDIKYLYQISEQSRVPIEINFEKEGFEIPCLSANTENSDYQAYVAIIPGSCLAYLYERYGARLLEQNVRSFLQFTGKINQGIRKTIQKEPHMFLAFNNGIAATADHIELDATGRFIKIINNLQIVNGGQTTASIYYTSKKENIDISKVFVQVKLSIIKNKDKFSEIVARISHYANTQNKVNDADFTANNPCLVAFEKLSRSIRTPTTEHNNLQTYWFFERARGQYKNLRQEKGSPKSSQKTFDLTYPKNQMFTKVELAKFINAYQEKIVDNKLIIGPHMVVRGNEKNYTQFIVHNLSDIKNMNNVLFEDTIAKAILFKTADKLYTTNEDKQKIGEMKNVVVPYTLSLLNILTNNKLDLYKIWKSQQISQSLSNSIYKLMKQINQFILYVYANQHYIEKAKKEECWEKVKENKEWKLDINSIKDDLIDGNNLPKRNIYIDFAEKEALQNHIDIADKEALQNRKKMERITIDNWNRIYAWGKDNNLLDTTQLNIVELLIKKISQNMVLSDEDCKKGMELRHFILNIYK